MQAALRMEVVPGPEDRLWLLAFGSGGCWSGYPEATILAASDREDALHLGGRVALHEADNDRRSGLSFDVELIDVDVAGTSLYRSRLLPEGRAWADAHWSSRDAVAARWRELFDEDQAVPERCCRECMG